MADGQKLERWGDVILSRPDPQIIWKQKSYPQKWKNINATYHRSKTGGGSWEYNKEMPNQWQIKYKELTFNIKPMGFKHTGLFPEQAVNWDYMIDKIKNAKREIKVLNLFAYTGGATVADVRLMRENTKPEIQVKAAGGIRTLDQLIEMYEAGATRMGCSRSAAVLEEAQKRFG